MSTNIEKRLSTGKRKAPIELQGVVQLMSAPRLRALRVTATCTSRFVSMSAMKNRADSPEADVVHLQEVTDPDRVTFSKAAQLMLGGDCLTLEDG